MEARLRGAWVQTRCYQKRNVDRNQAEVNGCASNPLGGGTKTLREIAPPDSARGRDAVVVNDDNY